MNTTSGLHLAIEVADNIRREHNGVSGVYLYLGHDGDNVCIFKDADATEICRGTSGDSLVVAVQRCLLAHDHRLKSLEV